MDNCVKILCSNGLCGSEDLTNKGILQTIVLLRDTNIINDVILYNKLNKCISKYKHNKYTCLNNCNQKLRAYIYELVSLLEDINRKINTRLARKGLPIVNNHHLSGKKDYLVALLKKMDNPEKDYETKEMDDALTYIKEVKQLLIKIADEKGVNIRKPFEYIPEGEMLGEQAIIDDYYTRKVVAPTAPPLEEDDTLEILESLNVPTHKHTKTHKNTQAKSRQPSKKTLFAGSKKRKRTRKTRKRTHNKKRKTRKRTHNKKRKTTHKSRKIRR